MYKQFLIALIVLFSLASCGLNPNDLEVKSPKNTNSIKFGFNKDGELFYFIKHNDKTIIDSSYISFDFKDQPSIKQNLKLIGSVTNSINDKWELPWGEQREVINHYNELIINLQEQKEPNRKFNLHIRAFEDGVAFRYEFLQQNDKDSVIILEENTEFQLTDDHITWWTPGDWYIYEHLVSTTKISEINAFKYANQNLAQTHIPENAVNTPVTMRTSEGIHITLHEANLTNYSDMTLKVDNAKHKFTSHLVGSDRLGYKVKRELPFKTPWRTFIIADKAIDLINSKMILNLNEPNKIGDVSWFKPKKYVGIWWEMHIDKASWDYGMTRDKDGKWVDSGKSHGRHGATTENAKRYIDFASKNGIKGVLVEGWNTGWENWIGFEDREGVFDFVTPYPDYNLEEVVRYAKEKNVELIMHHETSSTPRTYEKQLDTAYSLMKKLGINSVKTGYVGRIIPEGEYHHGQWMINHFRKVLETAAKYNIAVNGHEIIKDTGERRTFPNAIARETFRGQEFNAWAADGGNPPEHISLLAFTTMLAGPIDFTPGVFDIALPTKKNNQINTTIAHQLALYVVIYSPIQMACDLPENYENKPAFQFIRDVAVDWEKTVPLNGEVGDFVTIARQEKNTGNWFVGGITDENKREIEVNFDFLEDGINYEAIIYKDSKSTHYRTNPTEISIEKMIIKKGDKKKVELAEAGGFAISLIKTGGK